MAADTATLLPKSKTGLDFVHAPEYTRPSFCVSSYGDRTGLTHASTQAPRCPRLILCLRCLRCVSLQPSWPVLAGGVAARTVWATGLLLLATPGIVVLSPMFILGEKHRLFAICRSRSARV